MHLVSTGFPTKTCGDCTACCQYISIPAGQVGTQAKPAGVPCRHLVKTGPAIGCRIYENRCETCRRFECGWLTNAAWPDAWRPDRSGLLVMRQWLPEIGMGALVYETTPGALTRPVAMRMIDLLSRHCRIVCVVDQDGRRRMLRSEPAVSRAPKRPHFLSHHGQSNPHDAAESPVGKSKSAGLPLSLSPLELPLAPRERA